jgi:hypothetical protein
LLFIEGGFSFSGRDGNLCLLSLLASLSVVGGFCSEAEDVVAKLPFGTKPALLDDEKSWLIKRGGIFFSISKSDMGSDKSVNANEVRSGG